MNADLLLFAMLLPLSIGQNNFKTENAQDNTPGGQLFFLTNYLDSSNAV